MKMNRRNALLGLGAIATGGGALFGSGAFSQVEAERTVNVAVQGDNSAILGLDPDDSTGTSLNTASSLASDGTLQLDFTNIGSSSGINLSALTTWEPIFRAINNGGNSVDLSIYSNDGTTGGSALAIMPNSNQVISNTLNDSTNGTSVTIEYQFQDSNGNSIVGNGTNGVTISNGSYERIDLLVAVSDPGGTFNPSNVTGQYIQDITVTAY